MTNLGKTKEEIIYELLLAINHSDNGYIGDYVKFAIDQYDKLVSEEIIIEE